jgi:hypothetical protein
MYRIDGIYNSGYAHAPALIVNPSGSYPLIYNSTTGILQQTPNDQKVDKASEVEFKSVKTATVKSLTGTDAALIDSTGSIFAQNGLWSEKGVQISDLSLKKTVGTSSAYEIKAAGLNDKLSIYSTKGVSIGFANNNFLFEPANMLFQGPSFRLPSGASMWTSKIDSVTGQSAITIADNGTVSIPSLTLPSTGLFKQLVVNNLPNQSGQLFIEKPYNDNSFYIKSVSTDNTHSLDIYASSIRNRNGSGGLLMDDNSTTTFLAQVNNFSNGVYLNISTQPDIVNRLWYDGNLSTLNLQSTALKLNLSTTFSKVELNEQSIILANKVGTGSFTDTAAFSNTRIDLYRNVHASGYINAATGYINAALFYKNANQVFPPNQACDTTSSPTFAGLTTTPVLPSLKAPILTTSTEGAPTNSNPNGNGADLDVFDLRIRSGRLFTSATTLQLGKKFSCDKQLNITGNNATTGQDPFVSLRGAVHLQIGTTDYPTALIVNSDNGVVSLQNGIRVNDIKRPDGLQTYIDMNGARPSFPQGLDATLLLTTSAPSVVTYNSTTKTLGYTSISSSIPAYIRFAPNYSVNFNNSESFNNAIQTYFSSYVSSSTVKITYPAVGGYPPLIENAVALTQTPAGFYPNVFFSFQWQTPVESTNFPNVWENNVKQKFPALGSYMITWNLAGPQEKRRVLISINKNFNIAAEDAQGNDIAAANDPTCLAAMEHYTNTMENGTQITALVNITSLSDYVTYTMYNYDARTFLLNQGRWALSITKVG